MRRNLRNLLAAGSVAAIAVLGVALFVPGSGPHAQSPGTAAAPAQPAATFDLSAAMAEKVLGNPDAPITMIEFASLTCGACGKFHNEVLPKLKADFIDTGQVKLVYRDFPGDQYALAASMLARCAAPDRYFGFLSVLFKGQQAWAYSNNPVGELAKVARLGGLSQQTFDACLSSEPLQTFLLEQRLKSNDQYKIEGTPTFIFEGTRERFVGAGPYEDIVKILERLGAKRPEAAASN